MEDCSTRAGFSEGPLNKLERACRTWPVLTLAASQGRSSRPIAQKSFKDAANQKVELMTPNIAHIGGKESSSQLRH
jgi:hypothetical protein